MTQQSMGRWPALRRWLLPAFIASLMLNFLVAGFGIGHRYWGGGFERMSGANYVQLVPREFFAGLPSERRRELGRGIRDGSKGMRDMRDGTSQSVAQFADALEAESYSQDALAKTVIAFSVGEQSLAAQSSKLIIEMVAKLSPDERKQLAAAVRARAAHMVEKRNR